MKINTKLPWVLLDHLPKFQGQEHFWIFFTNFLTLVVNEISQKIQKRVAQLETLGNDSKSLKRFSLIIKIEVLTR